MIKQALYFAYGSNLDTEQMKRRCPGAKIIGPATMKDHRLIFRGVADIEPNPGSEVQGGLWAITDKCLEALDRYEGYPTLYDRLWFEVEQPGEAKKRMALVYVMQSGGYSAPSGSYLNTIARGYKDFGLDLRTLIQATEDTEVASRYRKTSGGQLTII
jgi:gamma-glutamylcyclotransferase (GGCT)/AIG2-like uncharacterized protein YtfP